jgi:hypothetical protein
MTKRVFRSAAGAAAFLALSLTTAAARIPDPAATGKKPTITVYKDPSCGCCKAWIAHLVKAGYTVDAKDSPNMAEIKRDLGVPDALKSCHTGIVDGYIIEGHVSPEEIDQLLAQKPKVAGLAVPGMPMGSPGMDGGAKQHYQVVSFEKNGKTKVFASH